MTNTVLPRASVTLCSPKLTQEPWRFDAPLPPHYGPGSSQDDVIPAHAPVQQTLPSAYCTLTPVELDERIEFTPAMVVNCRSSTVATDDAMVAGSAPGKLALTLICGMSTLGMSLTGRLR